MNEKPTRLGRGLAALIGDMATLEGARLADSSGGIGGCPSDFIVANRRNPRRDFDADQLEELDKFHSRKGRYAAAARAADQRRSEHL